MKRIILYTAAIFSAAAAAASEPADTIMTASNVRSVTVVQSGADSQIILRGTEDNEKYYYSFSTTVETPQTPAADPADEALWLTQLPFLDNAPHSLTNIVFLENLYVGSAIPVSAPTGLDPSVEAGIGSVIGIRVSPWKKGPSFGLGAGVYHRKYSLHGPRVFNVSQHTLSIIPSAADRNTSRLRSFGLQIPLSVYQPIAKSFGITVGGALMINTFTSASSDTFTGDVQTHVNYRGLQQRPITGEVFAVLGWKGIGGIYVRYSPQALFSQQWGPQFKTVSVGISIGM